MRALRCHSFGGPEVLRVDDVPEPEVPPRGAVHVRVRFAGLNFADTERRRGLYLADQPLPDTLGFEGAGEVVRLGDGVDPTWLGSRVAFLAPRAQAELCMVPVEKLISLPGELDLARAAAFPVQWLTAWHALHTVGRVQRGERVLIHSAAGGVGQALVQLAKAAGTFVIGTVSRDAKQAQVATLGADQVLTRPALPDEPVHLVLEGLGADVATSTLEVLAPFGRWVHFGTASGPLPPIDPEKLFAKSLTFTSYWLRSPHPPDAWERGVTSVLAHLKTMKLEPTVVPLDDAAKWHRRLEGALTTGKVVLRLD
jgi:NADPH2:quinone reductase